MKYFIVMLLLSLSANASTTAIDSPRKKDFSLKLVAEPLDSELVVEYCSHPDNNFQEFVDCMLYWMENGE